VILINLFKSKTIVLNTKKKNWFELESDGEQIGTGDEEDGFTCPCRPCRTRDRSTSADRRTFVRGNGSGEVDRSHRSPQLGRCRSSESTGRSGWSCLRADT
jgi:hypothetical protein